MLTHAHPMRTRPHTKPFLPIFALPDNIYKVDFGQNLAGLCTLKVRGPANSTVVMYHMESINPDGSTGQYTINCAMLLVIACVDMVVDLTKANMAGTAHTGEYGANAQMAIYTLKGM